jgi:acyl-CoA reductase-like NAD-dependent aldehyde dehydrogenase
MSVPVHAKRTTLVGPEQEAMAWVPRDPLIGGRWEAFRLGRRIDAGMVAIDRGRVSSVAAPFGGVKHSESGASGRPEGVAEYVLTRDLAISEP